jgi:hypothetical protein
MMKTLPYFEMAVTVYQSAWSNSLEKLNPKEMALCHCGCM